MKKTAEVKRVPVTPGKIVRAFRTSFEVTLKELQELTGIPQTNLSAIENDRMDMGVKRAVLLAAALGLAPEDILFPKGYERPEHKQAERIRVRAERLRDRKSAEAVRKRA